MGSCKWGSHRDCVDTTLIGGRGGTDGEIMTFAGRSACPSTAVSHSEICVSKCSPAEKRADDIYILRWRTVPM